MNLQCSWKVSDDRQITEAVVPNGAESSDLADDVSAENCLMLLAPDNDNIYPTTPACQLILSCPLPNQISKLCVFCEARFIEVYGHNGEYLKTVKNELIEEDEDMIVFKSEIFLDRPVSLCSIKFLSLRSPTEMWLFGLKIQTTKTDYVPFSVIQQRFQNMGLPPNTNADDLRHLVENFQKTEFSNNARELAPNKEHPANGVIKRDLENNLNSVSPDAESIHTPYEPVQTASVSTSPVPFESLSSSTQTDEEYINLEERIKLIVTAKLEELDKQQWERVNKRFQEVEAKILCKLDEIESFVKPQGVQSS